ncbi:hypothetical protein ERICIV_04537 (plasmid) [Paenibacillus larvae subsp. larvae]|uniref:SAF domain-containing protein n=1 Tax=Paenibacillus larvae subsp. larvae TaxID=147375 RepID=A0A2L1U7K6_9BACL|nr:SAF domain-containing protein [Paenibacillus larvae]AQT86996.1 hypothetical protein B1222_23475 [Paenibacillus larvae subsp. pulvifaciens]AQZ49329.1 hypothetical protein B5S25_22780 [Paenibacillus larvae subsp. pulvifaciens]AVF28919.1 hypothetical protein ERICIII_04917 [Paenibacillus larvae subsp. larvae]AVF33301.1 hypothetical protein ERICIV_04537 [Paenibacillus larvae subsp. larvae]MBH0344824.1 hypothetical protein [Paenibacillus larvae]
MNKKVLLFFLVLVGFGGFYYFNELQYTKVWVANSEISKGTVITRDMFREEKILSKKDWMLDSKDSVIFGKAYAKQQIPEGEYLSKNQLTMDPLVHYSDGEVTVGVRADNQWDVVGWQLEVGDLIGLEVYNKETKETIVDSKLMGLTVDSIVNRDGKLITGEGTEKANIQTVNLKANVDQAKLIHEYENKGSIKLVRIGKNMALKEGDTQ